MSNMPAIAGLGVATGTLSGFFGIGGGFLIVPALMLATGMPIMNAVSSSLVAVTAFGLTTAASYAWSGLVSWALAGLFVVETLFLQPDLFDTYIALDPSLWWNAEHFSNGVWR